MRVGSPWSAKHELTCHSAVSEARPRHGRGFFLSVLQEGADQVPAILLGSHATTDGSQLVLGEGHSTAPLARDLHKPAAARARYIASRLGLNLDEAGF
jgi:hypothetical protein